MFFPRLSSSSVLIFICCKITAGIKNLVYFYCALCEHWMWSGLKKASSKGTNKIRCQKQQHTITTVRVCFFFDSLKMLRKKWLRIAWFTNVKYIKLHIFFHLFLLLKRKICAALHFADRCFFSFSERMPFWSMFSIIFFSSFACQPIYLQKSLKQSQNT